MFNIIFYLFLHWFGAFEAILLVVPECPQNGGDASLSISQVLRLLPSQSDGGIMYHLV